MDVQTGIKMILKVCLADGFDMFPSLLVTDGSMMIDRRMGIHGHPLEIQVFIFISLLWMIDYTGESKTLFISMWFTNSLWISFRMLIHISLVIMAPTLAFSISIISHIQSKLVSSTLPNFVS